MIRTKGQMLSDEFKKYWEKKKKGDELREIHEYSKVMADEGLGIEKEDIEAVVSDYNKRNPRDGVTDCFGDKTTRDLWANDLLKRMRTTDIPSDVQVCWGESPYGEDVPYPFCVNMRWVGVPFSKVSEDWDNWRVQQHKEGMEYSDDIYAGPERVEEFDKSFMFIKCEDRKKMNEVI